MKSVVKYPIESITPFSLLDYPDKTACILWFAGCNMKCVYCYNPDIVFSKGKISYENALNFLRSRIGLLDGVVLSGGECTAAPDFVSFVKQVKELGFLVKVDTNGSMPLILEELIREQLLDYVALDYKSPKQIFYEVTKSKLYHRFERSFNLLCNSETSFEIRTTFHGELLSLNDLKEMNTFIVGNGYLGEHFIQHFINDTATIGNMSFNSVKVKKEDLVGMKITVRN